MPPRFVMNREDLSKITIKSAKEILSKIKQLKLSNMLPKDLNIIGIADNNLLGVFKLLPNEYGYKCYRMYLDNNNELLISDFGYQVTNIGEGTAPLDCNMDYIVSTSQLGIL